MKERQSGNSDRAPLTKREIPSDLKSFIACEEEDERPAKKPRGSRVQSKPKRRKTYYSESEGDDDEFLGCEDEIGIDLDDFFSKAKPVPLQLQRNKSLKQPESAARAASYARLTGLLAVNGLKERKVRGDGNCQFRALADQLYGDEEHHYTLRQQVIQQMESCKEAYCDFVLGSFDRYLARMRRSFTWGDHVTLQAAADALGLEVHLLTDYLTDSYIQVIPSVSKSSKVLRLCFWAEFHYNSVE